jgi:hypothetical protein
MIALPDDLRQQLLDLQHCGALDLAECRDVAVALKHLIDRTGRPRNSGASNENAPPLQQRQGI